MDADRAAALAQGLLDDATAQTSPLGLRPTDLEEAVRARAQTKARGGYATWGIATLDDLCGPLMPGELTLLGALTGVGKSSLALQVAVHTADQAGHTLYVSYEMSPAATGLHTLAAVAGLTLDEVQAWLDSPSLAPARTGHGQLDLTVYTHAPPVDVLAAQVRALDARRRLRLVVVDYVQQIGAPARLRTENRTQEVAAVSRALKQVTLAADVPVLACAQLSRAADGRGGAAREPQLSDLLDSGQLERDADNVLLLARTGDPGVVHAYLRKARLGPLDDRRLRWLAKRTKFADLAGYRSTATSEAQA